MSEQPTQEGASSVRDLRLVAALIVIVLLFAAAAARAASRRTRTQDQAGATDET